MKKIVKPCAVVCYKDNAGVLSYKVVSVKNASKALEFYRSIYSDVKVYRGTFDFVKSKENEFK